MSRSITLAALVATAALSALPLTLIQPANAQVDVYIGAAPPPPPPRSGPYGDRDRDGIPNRYDQYPNQQSPNQWSGRRDQDRDGIPNRYDGDRDGDGVPNRWDRNPSNPYRR